MRRAQLSEADGIAFERVHLLRRLGARISGVAGCLTSVIERLRRSW